MTKIIAALCAASMLALSACGGTSSDQKALHERAAKLSAPNTAKRIMRDYRKRGIPGKVRCVDMSTSKQTCTVTNHGNVVAHLDVDLNVDTGAIDVHAR
jgi:hypothetical protein